VGHHGSDTSTCQEFLSVVRPRVAIISSGADNVYGFPSDEVIQRLEACPSVDYIYRTDVNGTVEFISDGKNLWLQ
jgi:competence protein ComEC